MLLADVADTSNRVAATSGRLAKIELLAALLRQMTADEARVGVSWLAGDLPQRQIGVGWAALRSVPPAADRASLTIAGVDAAFSAIKAATGTGSQGARRAQLQALLGAATGPEQSFLRGLLSGGLRQGALAGVMTEAVARATDLGVDQVRRAAMLTGDLAGTAALAIAAGLDGLASVHLRVGRPIAPMLAQTASSVADVLARLGTPVLLQQKLDGARIQVHKSGDDVALFTRTLDDVTARMPEVVSVIRSLPARELVADGEVLTLHPDGRPRPFQLTASRVGTHSTDRSAQAQLAIYLFDLLHLDGADLLDRPTRERVTALEQVVDATHRVRQLVAQEGPSADSFLAESLAAGHEGIVAKALDAPYEAGRRGAGWLKVKPVHTLDLVVLAVEWGSGRRTGWLSNIHLGAARQAGDADFVMLGKTFKGMTDDMLAWQTARFRDLAAGPTDGYVVQVRPEQVVEIAFDGVQASTRYPGGVALRFARVLRYRDDKTALEIDTLDTVRGYLAR